MKRSKTIHLVLSGALAGSVLTGCGPSEEPTMMPPQPPLSDSESYTNNHHVHGVGYYHAPYRSWFPYPYNHYIPGRGYFHGGNWSGDPHASATTASQPTSTAVRQAQSARATSASTSTSSSGHLSGTSRGGFGGSSLSGGG